MAVVMEMHWPEVNVDHYEQAREKVRWEEEVPKGAIFHVAWWADDGFHVVDVWESEDEFNTFGAERLMPIAKGEIGLKTDPQIKFSKAHRIFDAAHQHARS